MRIVLGLMVALVLSMPSPTLIAQQAGSIAGTVADQSTRQPLAGVTVTLSGTQNRVVTDNSGRYRLPNVPPGSHTITASLMGYAAQSRSVTVGAGQSLTADLLLSPSAVQLEGIVVNAVTGTVERKRELGNAIGTVNAADITPAVISRPAEVLQGRVAGVTLQSTNGTSGTGQKIRIRGANSLSLSNEPLIIVDGIRYDNGTTHFSASFSESGGSQSPNRLNDLSPDDIASIEVLKGPAASGVYGTAAANGVIVITTKQGVADRTQATFYAERGLVQERTNYPDNVVALGRTVATGAAGACQLRRVASGVCVQDSIARFNVLRDERTTPFREGDRQKFGGTLSGGGSRATYYLSGDLEDEEGVFANNDLRRATLRANVRAPVTDKLTLTATTAYVNSSFSQPSTDNSVVGGTLNGLLGSALFDAENPQDIYYAFTPEATDQFTLVQDINRFTGGLTTNWRPFSWLSANSTAGIDFINNFDHQFLGPNIVPLGGSYDVGFVEENRGNTFSYTLNGALNATLPLSDRISTTSTVGFDYNRQLFQVTRAFGQGVTPGTKSLMGTSTGYRVGEDNTEVITIGGIAQQQVGISDRIFLTGAIRVDDNSAFGEDFGLISYPSLSGSWVVGEEPFFPQNDLLSSLRLRAAYGKSGLRPNFRDAVTFFRPISVSVGGSDIPGIALTTQLLTEGTGNVNLKPERTTEIEGGFDAGFFRDRISLEVTAFTKRSEDALISRTLPPSLGLSLSRFENLGEVRNSGVEVGLDARLLERNQFEWSARISGATLRNRIVELGQDIEPIILNRGMQKHEEGRPAGAFYQPKITFQDANRNGLIDYDTTEIRVGQEEYIGPVLPTFTGQLSTQLSFGKFVRVSTMFDMRRGHYQFNYTERFRCAFSGFGDRGCAGSYDPSSSLVAQAAYLGGILGDPVTRTVSNALWVEKADFVKWRELTVTLAPPSNWVRFLPGGGDGFSLTLAGRNLKTWTDYSGTDPESNETGSASNFTQGEFGTQPPVRYLTARLNFAF